MSKNFSSQSESPNSGKPVKSKPCEKIDSSSKNKEKNDKSKTINRDEMIKVNDMFVKFIGEVRYLEDENRKLKEKLKILKEKRDCAGNVDAIVKEEEAKLRALLVKLREDGENLADENGVMFNKVTEAKASFEDEINSRGELETEYIEIKKDLDENNMMLVSDLLDLEDQVRKMDFLTAGFKEEIKQLESMVCNETVILPSSNIKPPEMDNDIKTIEAHYAEVCQYAKKEVENMYSLAQTPEGKEPEMCDVKKEITVIVLKIKMIKAELEALNRKEVSLKKAIEDVIKEGDDNIELAQNTIREQEEALKNHKQELARQICQYQELLNLKLALDVEIATYGKLLHGEEARMNNLSD